MDRAEPNYLDELPDGVLQVRADATPRELLDAAGCFSNCAKEIAVAVAMDDKDGQLAANFQTVQSLMFSVQYLTSIANGLMATANHRLEVAR